MYKITKQQRDMIVQYLTSVVVHATVGANLVKIADILNKLELIKEEPKVAHSEQKKDLTKK